MPKATLATAFSKLALDVGAELAKDEDVRKMSKKVMDQLRPGGAPAAEKDKPSKKLGTKGSRSPSSGGGSSSKKYDVGARRAASTSRTYADPGRMRRPSLAHRGSHESGSGRSSPAGHHRSSRSASYGYPNTTQLLQPGVPAEMAQLTEETLPYSRAADSRHGTATSPHYDPHHTSRTTAISSTNNGAVSTAYAGYHVRSPGGSPTASPHLGHVFPHAYAVPVGDVVTAQPYLAYPPQHRAVMEARALDGYGSDGLTSQSRSGRQPRHDFEAPEGRGQEGGAAAPAGRERSNSLGAVGTMGLAGAAAALASKEDRPGTPRLPAPPLTPDNGSPNSSQVGANSKLSASAPAQGRSSGLSAGTSSGSGINIVAPPDGTSSSPFSHASAPSALPGQTGDSTLDGLSKKDGKKSAHGGAGKNGLTPSQSYDALASSRERIGAGVPIGDVTYAARCATIIYSLFDLDDTRRWLGSGKDKSDRNPTLLDVVFSDPGKSIKNWALFKRKSDGTLVISIRGTSRGPDWVDDMLCHLKEKDYALEKANSVSCADGSVFYAHNTFLRCAMAMVPEICRILSKRLRSAARKAVASAASSPSASYFSAGGHSAFTSPMSTPGGDYSRRGTGGGGGLGTGGQPMKLIITGHSAGGAVASLIYLLLEHHYAHLLAKFSQVFCITFGSAACVRRTRPLTSRPSDQVLAFILRGDPVPRLDMNYGLYLLDHYARVPSSKAASGGAAGTHSGDVTGNTSISSTGSSSILSGPGHATAKQTAARDLDGETFLAHLTELYGSERESERQASRDGTLEVPLQDLFPAGEMLMVDVGKADVWEIDAEKLEATSPVNVDRHEMKAYQRTLLGVEKAQPRLVID